MTTIGPITKSPCLSSLSQCVIKPCTFARSYPYSIAIVVIGFLALVFRKQISAYFQVTSINRGLPLHKKEEILKENFEIINPKISAEIQLSWKEFQTFLKNNPPTLIGVDLENKEYTFGDECYLIGQKSLPFIPQVWQAAKELNVLSIKKAVDTYEQLLCAINSLQIDQGLWHGVSLELLKEVDGHVLNYITWSSNALSSDLIKFNASIIALKPQDMKNQT
ncbi:MAG: hypothetical protein AAF443_08195 [Chlamydiota bacterium]